MNYIVFDLEWNQCPYGKGQENERIPFEIIEIGAVKLNSERQIIDQYQVLIQPRAKVLRKSFSMAKFSIICEGSSTKSQYTLVPLKLL